MHASDKIQRNQVAETIRRMASSPATRHYTTALPQFEVSSELPAEMDAMLRQLEKLERSRR